MRDIRFKAKRLDNGEWVKGYYYEECDNTYIIEDRQKDSMLNRNEAFLVDPYTVCQYTGFVDMKGRKIWEHDFVTDYPAFGEVIFRDGQFIVAEVTGDYPLARYVSKVKGFETFGRCLVTNQGSNFDKKGGEHEEVS